MRYLPPNVDGNMLIFQGAKASLHIKVMLYKTLIFHKYLYKTLIFHKYFTMM